MTMKVRILLDAEAPLLPDLIDLPDRAFRLYVSCACYSVRWSLDVLHINHARMFARHSTKRHVDQLVERHLAEWVDEPTQFRLTGEGVIWRGDTTSNPRKAIPERVRTAIYERDEYSCIACGATENLSLDHIYPHSRGGSDEPENLQTMCRKCNSRKGASV